MSNIKTKLLFIALMLLFAVSCSNPSTNPLLTQNPKNYLINVWENPSYKGEIYEYKEGYFYSYGGGYGSITYSITADEIVWGKDNTSGIIYGKYLESWDKPSIGKYYAVSFKNLTANSISISGAYTAATLEEDKKIFTIENNSFSAYSDCIQYSKWFYKLGNNYEKTN